MKKLLLFFIGISFLLYMNSLFSMDQMKEKKDVIGEKIENELVEIKIVQDENKKKDKITDTLEKLERGKEDEGETEEGNSDLFNEEDEDDVEVIDYSKVYAKLLRERGMEGQYNEKELEKVCSDIFIGSNVEYQLKQAAVKERKTKNKLQKKGNLFEILKPIGKDLGEKTVHILEQKFIACITGKNRDLTKKVDSLKEKADTLSENYKDARQDVKAGRCSRMCNCCLTACVSASAAIVAISPIIVTLLQKYG